MQKRREETEKERIAREARNAYYRKWRAENRDKVKANQTRYWAKKAKNANDSEPANIG